MLVTGLATGVRYRPVEVDHLTAEIAFDPVAHLSRLNVQVLHLDVELMEGTWRQSNEHLLAVIWISLFRRVREHPILSLLTVASWTQRDRPGELVGNVVPFVIPKPG